MSGHSKWHNIQAKKGKADAARGKIFTKIGREIAIAVREALEQQGLSFLSADVKMIPQNTVSITDEETAAKIEKLLDMLDDNDDVADVYHNAELPESDEEDE